ncbi:MAG: RHS repeat-associated core domain-containing protein, partial [Methylococcaceae bacterium]|nr:RHS repeat-associated core domain-containing protein [Methylococcaceae bacterium]
IQYQYDAAGNLTALTYPGNKTVSYSYDNLNRLTTVTIGWLNKTETYSYDAAGRHSQANRFNGSQTSYGYDNADRLTSLSHSAASQTLASYQYTLDANGNRTKAIATEPKLPEKLINNSQTYTYNTQKNRLTSQNGTALSYDQEGQLLTQGSTTYAFDVAHRLISQGTSSYVYDGIGNRIKATRNGQVTKYVYDAAGNLLAEANASNAITRYYIYGKGLTAMVDAASGQLYVYHFDGTGHTVAITNQSQQTQNTYAYDPYGKLMAQTETIAQPFKYAGQVGIQAEGNNLYYMRARYYDANLGRFISEDPIGHNGGLNLYAYVGGNPIMAVDPSGLLTATVGGTINIPGWVGYVIPGFIGQGVSAGGAIQFTGSDGKFAPDLGAYWGGQAGGEDYGIGRGSIDFGLQAGSIADLAGRGAEISGHWAFYGGSINFNENGEFSGGSFNIGPGYNIGGAGTIGSSWSAGGGLSTPSSVRKCN